MKQPFPCVNRCIFRLCNQLLRTAYLFCLCVTVILFHLHVPAHKSSDFLPLFISLSIIKCKTPGPSVTRLTSGWMIKCTPTYATWNWYASIFLNQLVDVCGAVIVPPLSRSLRLKPQWDSLAGWLLQVWNQAAGPFQIKMDGNWTKNAEIMKIMHLLSRHQLNLLKRWYSTIIWAEQSMYVNICVYIRSHFFKVLCDNLEF